MLTAANRFAAGLLSKRARDLRVHQILGGTNEIMRVVISRKVLGGNSG